MVTEYGSGMEWPLIPLTFEDEGIFQIDIM